MTRPMLSYGALAVAAPILLLLLATDAHVPGPGATPAGVVVTQVPRQSSPPFGARPASLDERYPIGSRVVHVAEPETGIVTQILSAGLAAAGGPDVAPDGRSVVFTGRLDAASRWRVFRTDLRGSRPRALSPVATDCGDPAWIASGRVVFACSATGSDAWNLRVADPQTDDVEQITFGDTIAFDPSPLADGRLVFSLRPVDDAEGVAGLFTINPDGTLLDGLAGNHDAGPEWSAHETADGGVVFVGGHDGRRWLERVDLTRPAATRMALPLAVADHDRPAPVTVATVAPRADGGFLLAARTRQGPWEILTGAGSDGQLVPFLRTAGWHLIEAVEAAVTAPPRGRPSALATGKSTGIVICYDAGRSDRPREPGAVAPAPVEVAFDLRTTELGRVPTAADRSFSVELPVDLAVRLRTIDESGGTIATCAAPIWVRPGEVRACFGCHEGHEAAPHNRLPEAITRPPVAVAQPITVARTEDAR